MSSQLQLLIFCYNEINSVLQLMWAARWLYYDDSFWLDSHGWLARVRSEILDREGRARTISWEVHLCQFVSIIVSSVFTHLVYLYSFYLTFHSVLLTFQPELYFLPLWRVKWGQGFCRAASWFAYSSVLKISFEIPLPSSSPPTPPFFFKDVEMSQRFAEILL